MTTSAFLVIPRDGSFLVVAPGEGLCVEHAELGEAHRLLEARRAGAATAAPSDPARTDLRALRPFFIKAATVAVVGAFLMITASVSFSYALHEPVRKAGQKLGRVTIEALEMGFADALKNVNPEQQTRIHQSLRDAVPLLKPYADDLKPLLQ